MKNEILQQNQNIEENPDMFWTEQELAEWIESELIPKELLDPSKYNDLFSFLTKNKETLYELHEENKKGNNYKIQFVPSNESSKESELQVIDRRSGRVIKVLEQITEFEICEGVCLQVSANELDDWKKETAEVQKLTKEQNKNLKKFLSKFGNERPLTRKDIITFIEEIQKPRKIPKYRQSGHFVDEKLKYPMPQEEQLNLFDLLSPLTKQKIEDSKIEVTAQGIKLTPPENKLVHALNRILHEKSQNKNPKKENFYGGNQPSELVTYANTDLKSAAPVLKFKPAELYKAYIGHDDYSGHDIIFINTLLHQLESKRFLIRYDRIKKLIINKKEETRTDRIEDFQSLIKIVLFMPDLTNEEKLQLDHGDSVIRDKKGEIIIALNPIFTDQIDTKFIEFPVDTNRRLVIAAGGHNKVTASMQTLMEWMLREMSNKRFKVEINQERLPYLLGLESYVKQNRKKRLQERIEKDIQAITNIGIILRYEKVSNSTGGLKWVFFLNKEYE